MKAIKAIYNFVVGDIIILIGVLLAVVILALIHTVSFLAPLRAIEGIILVLVVLAVLVATLNRETLSKR